MVADYYYQKMVKQLVKKNQTTRVTFLFITQLLIKTTKQWTPI